MKDGLPIYCKRLNEQAIIPTKAHATDAGWDLYCYESVDLGWDVERISTGISLAIPEGYYGQIQGRSGLAADGIDVFPGVIDSGYRGPIEVVMSYVGDNSQDTYYFVPGSKIAQIVILPVPKTQMVDVGTSELPVSDRGSNGFGSSDRPSDEFHPGPQDEEFWENSGQVTVKCGEKMVRVSGIQFNPDWTTQPTSEEDNRAAAIRIAEGLSGVGSNQDAPEKPQDAPGQSEDWSQVESTRRMVTLAQQDFGSFLEFLYPDQFKHGSPSGWLREAISQSMANFRVKELAKARENPPGVRSALNESRPEVVPMESHRAVQEYAQKKTQEIAKLTTAIVAILDFVEDLDQQEPYCRPWYLVSEGPLAYWEAFDIAYQVAGRKNPYADLVDECDEQDRNPMDSRPSEMLKLAQQEAMNLQKENAELRGHVQDLTGKLSVANSKAKPDVVSRKLYGALKEAYLRLEARNNELANNAQRLQDERDKYQSIVDFKSEETKALIRDKRMITNENDRLKLRFQHDQDTIGKLNAKLSDASRSQEGQGDISNVKCVLESVLEVLTVIKPRYLDAAHWDAINAAFDLVGKPSPFFGGTKSSPGPI